VIFGEAGAAFLWIYEQAIAAKIEYVELRLSIQG
jgi:hypothetical protein